jgi:hypothetical protein
MALWKLLGRVVPATSAQNGSCHRRACQPSTEYRCVPPCVTAMGQREPMSTVQCHCAERCAPWISVAECHRVPPFAIKCTHRPFPTRSTAYRGAPPRATEAPSGTEASEQHQVSTCASSGAQFSSTTEHHQAPLCAALRAMPTNADLTLICAGALQEPSQPILKCAETATPANAGRRALPNDSECHKVHTSARHRAPPSGATARCRPPRATACC